MGTLFQINESNGNALITGTLNMSSQQINNLANPVSAQDAATKNYVDVTTQGLSIKASCLAATTGPLPAVTAAGEGEGKTLTENSNGLLSIDGVSTWVDVVNDGGSPDPTSTFPASRVLIHNQVNQVDNGIYYVQDKGSASTPFILTRAPDFDGNASTDNDVTPGCFTFIGEGTVNASSGWVLTTPATNHTVNITSVDVDGVTLHVTSNAGAVVGGTVTQGLIHSVVTSVPVPYGTTIIVVSNAGFTSGSATLSPANIVVDVDNLTFSQFSGAGQITAGTGLSKSGNTISLLNPVAVNLGGTGVASWTDGQLLIGNTSGNTATLSTLTGTTNEIIVTNGHASITLSTPQAIDSTATPTFASETLSAATNQLVLGTTNTTTISSTAPSASRTYTIPDAGSAANFVLDKGNYTIGGTWTFSNAITITPTTNQLVLGTTRTVTISATQPATSSRTYTIPDQGAAANFVLDQSNYTIAGTWTFSNNITLASSKAVVFTDNTTHTVTMEATNSTTSWTFKLPTTAGSNLQVLQTDGSGNTSWAAAGTGTVTSVSGTTNQIDSTGGTTPVLSISSNFVFPGTINANTHKIASLVNGTASDDAAAFGQIYYGGQTAVQGTATTVFTTTSNTFQSTNLSASITPTTSTRRIKISFSAAVFCSNFADDFFYTIFRDSTDIGGSSSNGFGRWTGSTSESGQGTCSVVYIDSPGDTSSHTYTVKIRSTGSTNSISFGTPSNGKQIMILEELV